MTGAAAQFWGTRSAREKQALSAAAVFAAAAVFYSLVWAPLSRERVRLSADLPQLRTQLHQMRADADELGRLKAAAKPPAADLKSAVEPLAHAKPEISAGTDGRVRISIARVSAAEWFGWIAAMHAGHGLRVERTRVEALSEPGLVRVSADLARR